MMIVDESSLELRSVPEAAALLRVSPKTVSRLCLSGELESIKIGTRRLIPPQAIVSYIEAKRSARRDATPGQP
jgi:excisionase family DNA binding protein